MHDTLNCPFRGSAPDGMPTHTVPPHLRGQLVELWHRRARLNKAPAGTEMTRGDWYRASTPVFAGFEELENQLRKIAGATEQTCVDYFEDWRFRCADAATLKAEHLARVEKKDEY